MTLEGLLEILEGDDIRNYGAYVLDTILNTDVLQSAPEGSKHKLKTRISSLLKSNGIPRAYGALLAKATLSADWSAVKTHGPVWAPILIHMLDLPDQVGWVPAMECLTELFKLTAGKNELARDIGSSKVSDYVKRLISLVNKIPDAALDNISEMTLIYPGPFRVHAAKISESATNLIASPHWEAASRVLAALPSIDKTPAVAWRAAVQRVLDDIVALLADEGTPVYFPSDDFDDHAIAFSRLWTLLGALIVCGAKTDVKVPSAKLIDVMDRSLRSLQPALIASVLEFFTRTVLRLGSLYVRHFDLLFFHFVESSALNRSLALAAAKATTALIKLVAWVDTKYASPASRLAKRLHAAKEPVSAGVEGLADYVSHKESFERTATASEMETIAEYFVALVVHVNGLNNSTRAEIDSFFVNTGSPGRQLCTLYPGKFSVLPLVVTKYGLSGLETLVHPRFPPFSGQVNVFDEATVEEEETVPAAPVVLESVEVQEVEEPEPFKEMPSFVAEPVSFHEGHSLDGFPEPDLEPREEPILPVPEPSKPLPEPIKSPLSSRVSSGSAADLASPRPEKRARYDNQDVTEAPAANENKDEEASDDEGDFVMPSLNMDSD